MSWSSYECWNKETGKLSSSITGRCTLFSCGEISKLHLMRLFTTMHSHVCFFFLIRSGKIITSNTFIEECLHWQRKGPSRQVSPALVPRLPCPSHCLPAAHPEQPSMHGGELQGCASSQQTLEGKAMPHMYSFCWPLHAEPCRQEGCRSAPSRPR